MLQIDIIITDTNNRAPVIQALDKAEYVIFEKQDHVEIVNIIANDADRDGKNLVINKCLNMF